ncbi:hypothetical protein B7Y94_05915, partial [Candidatus Saccharibacteria bacterium 32-49-12]
MFARWTDSLNIRSLRSRQLLIVVGLSLALSIIMSLVVSADTFAARYRWINSETIVEEEAVMASSGSYNAIRYYVLQKGVVPGVNTLGL